MPGNCKHGTEHLESESSCIKRSYLHYTFCDMYQKPFELPTLNIIHFSISLCCPVLSLCFVFFHFFSTFTLAFPFHVLPLTYSFFHSYSDVFFLRLFTFSNPLPPPLLCSVQTFLSSNFIVSFTSPGNIHRSQHPPYNNRPRS